MARSLKISRYLITPGIVGLLAMAPPLRNPQRTQDLTIFGLDYAYSGVPQAMAAGPTSFSFENRGKKRHMMMVARLKTGITVDSAARIHGPARGVLVDGGEGVLVAEAGERAVDRLLVDLTPGRTYVVYCVFRDAPDKPMHEELGMFASFTVR